MPAIDGKAGGRANATGNQYKHSWQHKYSCSGKASYNAGSRPVHLLIRDAVFLAASENSHFSYLLGSYRIATAPEPNSRRLTNLNSICFDSPANNVGPWPASVG